MNWPQLRDKSRVRVGEKHIKSDYRIMEPHPAKQNPRVGAKKKLMGTRGVSLFPAL